MACADYRLCDVCSSKVFYDSNLNYDFDSYNENGQYKLDYLGDWAVICEDCAKTHKCVIVEKRLIKIADIEVSYVQHCGSDLVVANAARVSFDKESEWEYESSDDETGFTGFETLKQSDAKLINYLAKHLHKSPFNHSFITVKVKAPISVARQLVKHKFMPWNEISRRYVSDEPEFYIPDVFRAGAENVKQGSSEDDSGYGRHAAIEHSQNCLDEYNARLAHGVCAEQARDALPLNTHTEWYWSGTLGAFADMLVLRLSSYTQKESRIVAQKARDIIEPLFPVSLKALLNNG